MAEALSNMPNPVLWKLPLADLPGLLMPSVALCTYLPTSAVSACLPACLSVSLCVCLTVCLFCSCRHVICMSS